MPTAISSPSSISSPRPRAISKKLSGSGSGSTTATPSGSPLQPSRTINAPRKSSSLAMLMNDDAAEKAKRRKSAHFGELPPPAGEPKERPGVGPNGKRTVSALAVQQASSGGQTMAQRRAKRLSAVEPAQPIVSMEVMNTNFEEWMKLATDNKITANNTWNFALIDYFADLTLLRNGPDDQSINFQKASCTLDGCVKIYTSRVDSVATETGKLLSGLAGGSGHIAADDADGEGGDADDEEGGEPKTTRKTTSRSEATLAKSFAQLQVKKFDLEFTVDPLFKKTCADFDEGGAMGLLMNHLGVDGKGRVVFDAGDAGGEEEEEEEEADEEEEMVDLEKLRGKSSLLPFTRVTSIGLTFRLFAEFVPSVQAVQDLYISDTLSAFKFSSDPNSAVDFTTLFNLKDSYNDEEYQPSYADDEYDEYAPGYMPGGGEAHDFFGDEDYDMGPSGGFDDGASMMGDNMDAQEAYSGQGMGGSLAMAAPGERLGPFDPRRQAGYGELVMAFGNGDDDAEGMFDYFDKGFGKSWAGAEHWKLRKVTRKDAATPAGGSTAPTKTAKPAKAPFTIDFSSPSTSATSSKTLFAPATKSSITLPSTRTASSRSNKKTSAGKRREEWLLPDDMHFSSRQLLRLFLKPKFSLKFPRESIDYTTDVPYPENANGEIDENFWAQAAAERADAGLEGDDNDSQPIPFETQFFHDDMDDEYVDDGLDAGDSANMYDANEAEDLLQGSQNIELKKSRPENVHFAKKAKRVDVKRLKDDIWTGLKSLVPAEKDSSEDETELPKTPTKDGNEPVKTFDNIITSLRSSYPAEKMSEISTSFCFICLLHLANEEGLKIETARYDGKENEDVGCQGLVEGYEGDGSLFGYGAKGKRLDQGEKKDRIVGELQAMRVYKDHTAGRAA
ncbi:hypothetical protein L486_03509 [Kwoniella mangroviensis CBS 10435]|uniref:Condensin complex subunit 2 n=1 Tax=Kwoniella mangroviensis CBS 10435 TaxID=1331196 RepID=A0A1B9ITZ5_9TREE|nr:hypothetical protein L486_03509 [Kwoniella mangroviensis CBS 10435]